MNIRIVSYNIHSGIGVDKKLDYGRIGRFLASTKADIVCLQEIDFRHPDVDSKDIIKQLKSDYFNVFRIDPAVKTARGVYGNAVLSRHNIKQATAIDVSYAGQQERNIQNIEFQVEGRTFTIFNAHFGLKAAERRAQFTALHASIKRAQARDKTPGIAIGDVNEWRPFTSSIRKMNSAFDSANLGPSFPNRAPVFKLDRAWCYSHLQINEAIIIRNNATKVYSDHLPILIDLEI